MNGRSESKLVVLSPERAVSGPEVPIASEGTAVVVAGEDAGAVGAAVAALRARGVRAAGFVGSASDPAVAEMAAELFPGAERTGSRSPSS